MFITIHSTCHIERINNVFRKFNKILATSVFQRDEVSRAFTPGLELSFGLAGSGDRSCKSRVHVPFEVYSLNSSCAFNFLMPPDSGLPSRSLGSKH